MTQGVFERVTKSAIEEIIERHSAASKFGRVLTPENLVDLRDEFYDLMVTSRNLKSNGDRLLGGGASGPGRSGSGGQEPAVRTRETKFAPKPR